MSTPNSDYSAPTVSEYNLDPGGNYVSPVLDVESGGGSGTLSASVID